MPNVSNLVKTIQDIMRKDAGTYGDAQRLEQLGWMFFLKIFDDREKELELLRDAYKSPLPQHLRWSTWATDAEGITGDALLDFVNNTLLPKLKSLTGGADKIAGLNLPLLFHPSYAIPPADLRKSILTLAVQGKLVPQDPNDEPAEELLKRVDAEREQLVRSKTIRRQDFLGPVADDAIPFDIPASWQWRYLADISFLITDGAHHTPQYLETGVPFLSVKDVSGGSIDFSSTRFISEEAHRELCKR